MKPEILSESDSSRLRTRHRLARLNIRMDLHASLDTFVETPDYNIQEAIVLSNEREIRQSGKITYLPIYFAMFLRPSTPPDRVMIE